MTITDRPRPRSVAHAREETRRGMPAIDRALADLAEVETLVPLVALLRDPTAARPWREARLDAEARAERDYAARQEIAERTEEAPGEHQDAARADVLDVLSGVRWRADDLAWHLARAARTDPLSAIAGDGDPRPYLAHARACLIPAVTSWANGAEIAHYAADRAAAMRADLENALALNVDGHVLATVCPWCRGRTDMAPAGGEHTWRVRVLPGELGVAIVCESGTCQPPKKDAGTWWRGCPVWPFASWEWLARRLDHLDARRAADAPPPPVRPAVDGATGRAGTPITPDAEHALLAGVLDHERPA